MKTSGWLISALAVLLQAGALHAQIPPQIRPAVRSGGELIVSLTQTTVDRVHPLLTSEARSGSPPSDAELAQVGVSEQQYAQIKASLIIAWLDRADPTRLAIEEDPWHARRISNVNLYQQNAARLNRVIQGVSIDPGCALCQRRVP
jgi:hypothetical protein